ncbi:MAG: hypothetical protein CL840_05835 [Crocinitomicaceae bacterium]|nr:hypothetical protein [Crocinitomicaceae bacterium]|tara:strand:- start:1049 stop:1966 length:918 start_codon:yes stop_codon:yes gene_type:complete
MIKNKLINTMFIFSIVLGLGTTTTSCKKEGCTDENATNYDKDAKKNDNSCVYASNEPDKGYNTTGLTEIAKGYAVGAAAEVVIYAKEDLFTGYNFLYVLTLDSATRGLLSAGHLSINPMMDMGMHKHSSPVENPIGEKPNANGLYEAQTFFVMPSGNGTWELTVNYRNHSIHKDGVAKIPVTVKQPTNRVMDSFIDSTSTNFDKVFISYVLPEKPMVGLNDMEIAIFYKKSMMEWPARSDFTVEIEPTMPSMGHGSPNNVHPTHISNGHYKGKINYSMTGMWKIDVKIMRNGKIVNRNNYFEYTL